MRKEKLNHYKIMNEYPKEEEGQVDQNGEAQFIPNLMRVLN